MFGFVHADNVHRFIERMLDGKATDPLSFLGIGGIHGLPAEAWAGATPPTGKYYCAHGTELFPTWHRPYVSLLEVSLDATSMM